MSTPIPRGIEVLVHKAAIDPSFKALLIEDRETAAAAIGLELEPAESQLLAAVPASQLEAIIARTDVPQEHRRAFLGQAAAAMLAALAAAAPVDAVAGIGAPTGIRPGGLKPEVDPAAKVATSDAKLEQRVTEIVVTLFRIERAEVKPEKAFVQDYKATAAHMVRLRQTLEKEFQITITRDEFKKVRTVGQAIACVKMAQQKKRPQAAPTWPSQVPSSRGIRPDIPPAAGLGGVRP